MEFANLSRAQDFNAPPVSPGPAPESAAPQSLPAVVVHAPPETKPQRAKQQEQQRGSGKATRTASPAHRRNSTTATAQTATAAARTDAGFGGSDRVNAPQQVVTADKTGTKLEDLTANVQIIPRQEGGGPR